ncbi:hypothetical protein A2U01_0117249, partial [Trifolium medium]|nr:hypothetical protein [Trifolium medium]
MKLGLSLAHCAGLSRALREEEKNWNLVLVLARCAEVEDSAVDSL